MEPAPQVCALKPTQMWKERTDSTNLLSYLCTCAVSHPPALLHTSCTYISTHNNDKRECVKINPKTSSRMWQGKQNNERKKHKEMITWQEGIGVIRGNI